jgi:hypothetical protein
MKIKGIAQSTQDSFDLLDFRNTRVGKTHDWKVHDFRSASVIAQKNQRICKKNMKGRKVSLPNEVQRNPF